MDFVNTFLYIGLPYTAIVLFLVGTIYRYKTTAFQYSSLSSQFLEGRRLFWGSVPFHWGLIILFFGHLAAFLIPDTVLAWNSEPVRLMILEFASFIFGLTVLAGLVILFTRRLSNQRLRDVTSPMDITVEVILLAQVVLGLITAYSYRWGSSWFASTLSPYLQSIFILQPEITAVSTLPLVPKLHVVLAFVILALIPFTRLVHILVVPLHYLKRPYQRVMWNWDRKEIREVGKRWTQKPPTNN